MGAAAALASVWVVSGICASRGNSLSVCYTAETAQQKRKAGLCSQGRNVSHTAQIFVLYVRCLQTGGIHLVMWDSSNDCVTANSLFKVQPEELSLLLWRKHQKVSKNDNCIHLIIQGEVMISYQLIEFSVLFPPILAVTCEMTFNFDSSQLLSR